MRRRPWRECNTEPHRYEASAQGHGSEENFAVRIGVGKPTSDTEKDCADQTEDKTAALDGAWRRLVYAWRFADWHTGPNV
jgi:hypothetical protein